MSSVRSTYLHRLRLHFAESLRRLTMAGIIDVAQQRRICLGNALMHWRNAQEDGVDMYNCLFKMDLERDRALGEPISFAEMGLTEAEVETARRQSYLPKAVLCLEKLRKGAGIGARTTLKQLRRMLVLAEANPEDIDASDDELAGYADDGVLEEVLLHLAYLRDDDRDFPRVVSLGIVKDALEKGQVSYDELGTSEEEVRRLTLM
jgi:hypothetical protein